VCSQLMSGLGSKGVDVHDAQLFETMTMVNDASVIIQSHTCM
jgi:hypothetical protein